MFEHAADDGAQHRHPLFEINRGGKHIRQPVANLRLRQREGADGVVLEIDRAEIMFGRTHEVARECLAEVLAGLVRLPDIVGAVLPVLQLRRGVGVADQRFERDVAEVRNQHPVVGVRREAASARPASLRIPAVRAHRLDVLPGLPQRSHLQVDVSALAQIGARSVYPAVSAGDPALRVACAAPARCTVRAETNRVFRAT